jgi:hypothetical protein
LTRLSRASTTLVRFNCDGDKAKSALRTVDDLRQLNQLFSYTRAQDSAQELGVCDEIVIGGGPAVAGVICGPGKAICGH